jgi:hypothetical protein
LSDENDYLKNRLEEQRSWYAQKSAYNKSKYRMFQTISIIASTTIPVINLGSGWSNDTNIQHGALLTTSLISAAVAIIIAYTQMEKYFETWILYRTTAEALKREKFLFLNSCGEYSHLNGDDKHRLLVERVEAMLSSENSKFFAFQQQTRQLQQQPQLVQSTATTAAGQQKEGTTTSSTAAGQQKEGT